MFLSYIMHLGQWPTWAGLPFGKLPCSIPLPSRRRFHRRAHRFFHRRAHRGFHRLIRVAPHGCLLYVPRDLLGGQPIHSQFNPLPACSCMSEGLIRNCTHTLNVDVLIHVHRGGTAVENDAYAGEWFSDHAFILLTLIMATAFISRRPKYSERVHSIDRHEYRHERLRIVEPVLDFHFHVRDDPAAIGLRPMHNLFWWVAFVLLRFQVCADCQRESLLLFPLGRSGRSQQCDFSWQGREHVLSLLG